MSDSAPFPAPAPAVPARSRRPVPMAVLLGLSVAIAIADAATPPGVVVGALFAIPIILASTRPSRREVLLTAWAAAAAFVGASVMGEAASTPLRFWVPNHLFVVLSFPATIPVALLLQERRVEAERARDAAVAAAEINGVLMSLLAHDLRAPLVVARQCISYVEEGLAEGRPPNLSLLADTSARLDRSMRAIEIVLEVARAGVESPGIGPGTARPVKVGEEIRAEVESFESEAALRGKRLELRLDGVGDARPVLNPLVLRQALAILLDNALRYAVAGVVTVTAELRGGKLRVAVADEGAAPPGAGAPATKGAGLGLELSRALLSHARGTLERDPSAPGSCWVLSLPAHEPASAPSAA